LGPGAWWLPFGATLESPPFANLGALSTKSVLNRDKFAPCHRSGRSEVGGVASRELATTCFRGMQPLRSGRSDPRIQQESQVSARWAHQ
jgi:hypothetical protein